MPRRRPIAQHVQRLKIGRPVGSRVRLLDDPDRFRIAAFVTATDILGARPHAAAHTVGLMFSDRPLEVGALDDAIVRFSGQLGYGTAKGQAGALVRKCQNMRLKPLDTDWLATSTAMLAIVIRGERPAIPLALDNLLARGWRDALINLLRRISEATASNRPPITDLHTDDALAKLDAIRARLKIT